MCFSATASFGVAALLMPAGIYSLKLAQKNNPKWTALAAFPLAFSIQQFIEGVFWLGLSSNNEMTIFLSSRGFLFFSHFFWLAWVPFAVYKLEEGHWRKKLLYLLTWLGFLSGASLIVPFLTEADWVSVKQVHHSLQYETVLIYDGFIDRSLMKGLYGAFMVLAFFVSSDRRIQGFGVLIALALLITDLFFSYALISVWCFFSAVLSLLILLILLNETKHGREITTESSLN